MIDTAKTILDLPHNTPINVNAMRIAEPIRRFCLIADAMAISLHVLHGQPVSLAHQSVSIRSITHNLAVLLPYPRFLQSAVSGSPDFDVEFVISKRGHEPYRIPYGGSMKRFGSTWIDAAAAQFVMFYEQHHDAVSASVKRNHDAIHPTWKFAKVARNAAVHGGINIANPKFQPVSWHGLTIGQENNGEQLWGVKLSPADAILLMYDMELALNELGL